MALEPALSRAIATGAICDRLRPVATTGLQKGSIACNLSRRLARLAASDSPLAKLSISSVEAELARRNKHFREASDLLRQAGVISYDLELEIMLALNTQNRGRSCTIRGASLDEAIGTYRAAIERLEELGQTSFRSTTLISLGEVLYECGQADEAMRLALEGEQLSAAEDVVNFAWGRGLRARITADRGSHREAESLAREAFIYAYETDFPRVQRLLRWLKLLRSLEHAEPSVVDGKSSGAEKR